METKKTYAFREWYIPIRMMPGIKRYTDNHIRPGGFLQAVISNDLMGALMLGDDENVKNLTAFVMYFKWQAPPKCYGSKAKMEAWIEQM